MIRKALATVVVYAAVGLAMSTIVAWSIAAYGYAENRKEIISTGTTRIEGEIQRPVATYRLHESFGRIRRVCQVELCAVGEGVERRRTDTLAESYTHVFRARGSLPLVSKFLIASNWERLPTGMWMIRGLPGLSFYRWIDEAVGWPAAQFASQTRVWSRRTKIGEGTEWERPGHDELTGVVVRGGWLTREPRDFWDLINIKVIPVSPIWSGLTANAAFYGLIAFAMRSGFSESLRLARYNRGACPGCGYDLRHVFADRCPECGRLPKGGRPGPRGRS